MISFSNNSSYIAFDFSIKLELYLSMDLRQTKVNLFAFASIFVPSIKIASASISFSFTSLERIIQNIVVINRLLKDLCEIYLSFGRLVRNLELTTSYGHCLLVMLLFSDRKIQTVYKHIK